MADVAGAATKINRSRKPVLTASYGINLCFGKPGTLDHLKGHAEHQRARSVKS